MDDECGGGVILEIEIVPAAGAGVVATGTAAGGAAAHTAGQGVARPIFDHNGLGRGIKHIALGHLGFGHYHSAAGNETGDGHSPILPGGELANQAAVAVLDRKFGVGYGLSGDGIHFPEGQTAQGVVVKIEGLGVVRGDLHGLRPVGLMDGVAVNALHLRYD